MNYLKNKSEIITIRMHLEINVNDVIYRFAFRSDVYMQFDCTSD